MSNYNCYILRIEVIYVQMKMEAIFEEIVCDDVHKLFKQHIDR